MKIKLSAILLTITLACVSLQARDNNIFYPPTEVFTKDLYRADGKNWAIQASEEGMVYTGNNRGLLVYDGYRWELLQHPGAHPIRALLMAEGRVYVGSYMEFGFYNKNTSGRWEYTSLSATVDEDLLKKDEIWNIEISGDRVVFQSFYGLYVYDGVSVKTFRFQHFIQSFHIHSTGEALVWFLDQGVATVDLTTGEFQPSSESPFNSYIVRWISEGNGSHLVLTFSDGLFRMKEGRYEPFPTEIDALIKRSQPLCAVRDSTNGSIYIGTKLEGIFVLSPKGKLLWHFSTDNLLPDNIIEKISLGVQGDVWAATGNGIARIMIQAPTKNILNLTPSVGDINTALYTPPYLYLGTSQGLYKGILTEDFQQLKNIEHISSINTSVLSLSRFSDQVFCGTNDYTFELTQNNLPKLQCRVSGGADMDSGTIHGKEVIIQGTYTRLCVYIRENGQWKYSHKVEDFLGPVTSCKIAHDGTIWAASQHGGLYAMKLEDSLQKASSLKYYKDLDSNTTLPIQVCRYANRVVFCDGKTGVYTYDDIHDKIVPLKHLGAYSQVQSIVPAENDTHFFLFEDRVMLMKTTADSLVMVHNLSYPKNEVRSIDGPQRIVPLGSQHSLLPRHNALIIFDNSPVKKMDTCSLGTLSLARLRIEDFTKGEQQLIPLDKKTQVRIPYRFNNLTFTYCFPSLKANCAVSFRYKVTGLDNQWHSMGEIPDLSLKYLREGKYTVCAQAVSPDGKTVSQHDYTFVIKPPFYRSMPMYALSLLLVFALISLYIAFRKRQIINEKNLAIRRIREEEMENELRLKNEELSERLWTRFHWNEALMRIKKTLTEQKLRLGKNYPDKDFSAVCNLIDKQMFSESEWDKFSGNFDLTHNNFITRLAAEYPQLSENDIRFCTYLRMNIENKELATLLNLSPKGVEAARYRLRKKFGLGRDESLNMFLLNY